MAPFFYSRKGGPAGYKQCAVVASDRALDEPGSNPASLTASNETKNLPSGVSCFIVAGPAGFEPANAGTKTQCLTAWRRSNLQHILAQEKGRGNRYHGPLSAWWTIVEKNHYRRIDDLLAVKPNARAYRKIFVANLIPKATLTKLHAELCADIIFRHRT